MLTIQFVPYSDLETLSSVGRIRKLLNLAKEDKIVLLEGRLKKEEEKELIKSTMEEINKDFKGIELAVIEPNVTGNFFRKSITNLLMGNRIGMTLIGPASIVKEIKRDPSKMQFVIEESTKRKRIPKKSTKKSKR